MKRIALCLLLILCGVATAHAFDKGEQYLDKSWQASEPWWNPMPGNHVLSDVAEVEPLNDTCPGQTLACGDVLRPGALVAGDNDYITFTANAGDIIVFGTDTEAGSTTDTYIYLYNADCSTQLAFDDDSGPGAFSLLSFCAPTTGSYVGRIRHYSATGTGAYKAFVACTSSGGWGDDCASATLLPCGTVDLAGHTGCSLNDYTPPTPSCTRYTEAGRDQVLALTVNAGGFLDLAYRSAADGAIYLLDSCSPVNCVAGEDSTLAGGLETLQYTFPTAGTYYLVLDSFGTNASGAWTLTGTLDCGTVAVEPRHWTSVKKLYQ